MLHGKAFWYLVYQDGLLTGCFYFHKKSIFCGGEHIWETLWTSVDSCSDTVDVFSRVEKFVAATFQVAIVGFDKLLVLTFLRLGSGSGSFCGPFLKSSNVMNSIG